MSRAKTKTAYSLSFPVTEPLRLPETTFALLVDDVNLDPRRDAARCEAFRAAVTQKLSSHLAWCNYLQTIPLIREQMAELRGLQPKIQATLNGLLELSPLARTRLSHAYVDAGRTDSPRIEELTRCIDGTIGDLATLVAAFDRAQANWSTHRLGRRPDPLHTLIKDLASLFAKFDADEHDDDSTRRSARDAFIRRALKAISVRSPKRFDDILSEK